MNFVVIIPIRLFSVRFPGKALADIHGKPMIVRVMEKALDSGAHRVIVATDNVHIARSVESEQSTAEVCFTRSDHQSGTERLSEVVMRYKFPDNQVIVHLQGDEPLITSVMICQIARILSSTNITTANMVTLATPLNSSTEAYDDNIVKVVVNKNNDALYFSRSVIPWHYNKYCDNHHHNNKKFFGMLLRHVGIYAYRSKFFRDYIKWVKSPLEQLEQLEQLRVLWYGEKIYVSIIDNVCNISVDTPKDLDRVNMFFKQN